MWNKFSELIIIISNTRVVYVLRAVYQNQLNKKSRISSGIVNIKKIIYLLSHELFLTLRCNVIKFVLSQETLKPEPINIDPKRYNNLITSRRHNFAFKITE